MPTRPLCITKENLKLHQQSLATFMQNRYGKFKQKSAIIAISFRSFDRCVISKITLCMYFLIRKKNYITKTVFSILYKNLC